jgi:phage tail-like protein
VVTAVARTTAAPAPRTLLRVPDLVGQPLARARVLVEHAGLALEQVLLRESHADHDTVLEQTPGRGLHVAPGARVTLVVARRGYLELLPAVFRRSDAEGRNLVRDLCFVLEHMFGSVEEILDGAHRLFDPRECPPELLPWLATWTRAVAEVDWPLPRQRALIHRAVELYRIRGTVRGLSLAIELLVGVAPVIEEGRWPLPGIRLGVAGRIGVDAALLPPIDGAGCFTVTIPLPERELRPELIVRLHELIGRERPAHVPYQLRFAPAPAIARPRPGLAIGIRSGIGVGDALAGGESDEPAADPTPATTTAAREESP